MSLREDGLRSLRCCKRRSVISNLRGFGSKWASSRLRIAVIHPSPLRSNYHSSFCKSPTSSELALAAVAGLSLQGHSVTLYTSGYRQKDIPEYLWETSGDVKPCIPRMARLVLFPANGARYRWVTEIVSIIISIRVVISCALAYLVNFLLALIPWILQKARFRHQNMLDVVITFEDTILPHFLLCPFVGDVVHFPNGKDYASIVPLDSIFCDKVFNLSRTRLVVCASDSESIRWSMLATHVGIPFQVVTVYPPVVALSPSALTPTSSSRRSIELSSDFPTSAQCEQRINAIIKSARPFFMALAWYPEPSDLTIAVEAFSLFLHGRLPSPVEGQSEPEEEGCTGSATLTTKPVLVIAGVDQESSYLSLLREINRFKLIENDDVVIIDSNCPSSLIADLMNNSVGLIHTPGEVNHVRIACAAMLACRPVITTVSFSKTEPVRHEATGILVKARSGSVIAQAIENLFNLYVNRQHEWRRMGLRGRQRVLTEFSVEMFGSRLDDLLELMKTSGLGPSAGGMLAAQQPGFPVPLGGPLRARSISGSARATSYHSGLNEFMAAGNDID